MCTHIGSDSCPCNVKFTSLDLCASGFFELNLIYLNLLFLQVDA